MDWVVWVTYIGQALVAGVTGYSVGGWPAALIGAGSIIAGLIQPQPHKT